MPDTNMITSRQNVVSSVAAIASGQVELDVTPLPAALAPFLTRVGHFCILWVVKAVVAVYLELLRLWHPSPSTQPTTLRYYACRPALQVRIFMPHDPRDADSKIRLLPLYIDIHGGGFAVGNAFIDDSFCTSWCTRTGMIVASLNYTKTPLYPFPSAVHDIAAIARAVIDDESLPVDKARVVIGGFSAGGNLCLTASLLPELQGRVQGTVSYYPIVDWSSPPHAKFANRLYTEKRNDTIATAGPFLDWGYVPAGQNRKDILLSPCYARREQLPQNICIVAAQHDMLCREARDMMYSLAGRPVPERGWDAGFEEGGYKWMLVKKVRHGFTDDFRRKKPSDRETTRKILCDRMYADIHRWLSERDLVHA